MSENEKLTTKSEVEAWLDKYGVKNYTIDEKLKISVKGQVDLSGKDLTFLPVDFQHVNGHFYIVHNKLTSLEGCPRVVKGDFYCGFNPLKSLEYAPSIVGAGFSCCYSNLLSLKGAPKKIGEMFDCRGNQLKSLEFCPENVVGNFNCSDNQLKSLEFLPKTVGEQFICGKNKKLGSIQQLDKDNFSLFLQEQNKIKIAKEKQFLSSTLEETKKTKTESFKI